MQTNIPGWAWFALVIVSLLDFMTTVAGLNAGLVEKNPVMSWALVTAGVGGVFCLKGALVTTLVLLIRNAGPLARIGMAFALVVTTYTVMHNIALTAVI